MGFACDGPASGPSESPSLQPPSTSTSTGKQLSRSLTFDVENDEDLAAFMGDVPNNHDIQPDEQDHIDLAIYMTRACWLKYQHWPKEFSTTAEIQTHYLPSVDDVRWPIPIPWDYEFREPLSPGKTIEKSLQTLIREEFRLREGGDSIVNVLARLMRNPLDNTTVDIELRIRWRDNNMDSLKSPEALENEFVQMYWANGGAPVVIVEHDLVWTHSAEGGIDCTLLTLTVPATFDIVPCAGPSEPFALKLFDYQLRTLAWMQGIEDREPSLFYAPNLFQVENDLWVDLESRSFIKLDDNVRNERNVTSGIIADKPGVGKTITTLALCHSRPFEDQDFLYSMHNDMFRSKATLILVPNNIVDQWEQEIRKCLGDSVSVIQMKGKANYTKTSFQDILTCDFVIVSYQFLVNKFYLGAKESGRCLSNFGKKFDLENSADDRQKFVASRTKGNFSFTWCHFHRIVCDELHEILEKQYAIRDQVQQLSANCLWGLTGTPTFDSRRKICRYADFLNLDATETWLAPQLDMFRFIQNRVRRNEPDVTYPPPLFETFSCRQTPMERAFYQSCTGSRAVDLLKLCNHYQIGREGANLGIHAAVSIEKVTQMVQKNRISEMADLTDEITRMDKQVEGLRLDLDAKRTANIKAEETKLQKLNANVAKKRVLLVSIQAQFNFFENFVNTYLSKGGQKIECNVCLEEDVQGKCPSCREVFQVGEVMKVLPPSAIEPVNETVNGEETVVEDGPDNLDPNMFGSKIREVVKYIKEESLKSDEYRFIVFIQFSDLADLVSAALKTYGLSTARVNQGWQQRERALRLFRAGLSKPAADGVENSENVLAEISEPAVEPLDPKGKGKRVVDEQAEGRSKAAKQVKLSKPVQKPVKVLMLSARDSVSGLNLIEASHCIILHPFVSEKEENAVASEQQGIARVLRKGQEKPVKIVRFYVERTVEQVMHEARVQALDAFKTGVNLNATISFENVTALPVPNTYNDTMNEDGSVRVSFTNANYNIEIPANHTIK
ncbi:SNF2 family N-terminal domain-containing protein [Chytriomyces cf. hyalinus JEL632]|nr:SNF2 family N-terminal domain-containing protein [Chytriomyces cf. hyalinus JEL632]